ERKRGSILSAELLSVQQARQCGSNCYKEGNGTFGMIEGTEGVSILIGDIEAQLTNLFDDPDFNAIHQQLSPFNLFEAVGAIRAELRHSNFLAYLLSPSRPHGLGAMPLLAILRAILKRIPPHRRPVGMLELIAGQLDDAIVYRERDNIDILVDLPTLELVVAIENKIDSKT